MQREIMTGGGELEPRPDRGEREGFGDLVRQLAQDTAALIRQEASLAKLEMKETATALGKDAVRISIAIGLAVAGGLALTACLVLVIGNLLGDAYWAGALIVGALFLLIGALMARSAIANARRQHLVPDETLESLGEDRRWLQREARDFRREALS